MNIRASRLVLCLIFVTSFAGCATGGGTSDPFSENRDETEVRLSITNLAFMDATVWGISNGGRTRLGRVTGKDEAVFSMPLAFPSEFYLEIDFLAGPTCLTERMVVDPGDHLELIIENEPAGWICRGPAGD